MTVVPAAAGKRDCAENQTCYTCGSYDLHDPKP